MLKVLMLFANVLTDNNPKQAFIVFRFWVTMCFIGHVKRVPHRGPDLALNTGPWATLLKKKKQRKKICKKKRQRNNFISIGQKKKCLYIQNATLFKNNSNKSMENSTAKKKEKRKLIWDRIKCLYKQNVTLLKNNS